MPYLPYLWDKYHLKKEKKKTVHLLRCTSIGGTQLKLAEQTSTNSGEICVSENWMKVTTF